MKTKLFTLVLALVLTFGAKAQYPNVSLWNIQYSTVDSVGAIPNSPYTNQYVNTGGIITGTDKDGYYIQTSYATEWAAVNVYDKTYKPAVGDSVTITGQVIEYYNETELDSIKSLTVVSTDNQARTPVTLVAFDSINRRKYQGMLVKVKDATCLRFNAPAIWWVFYDSTMTNSMNSEDTIDNIIMTTQKYTPGKKYNITGCVHHEYANWIEPRNIDDIDSINVTGINEISDNKADINLFPNPNNGVFTVSVNVNSNEKNTMLILADLTGRVIYKEQSDVYAGKSSIPIDISNLAKGTYFLKISNSQYSSFKKVVIE
ncbi:MAG: T9SS type A sorting domain-containing protein [Bacteroidia bacterium]